MKNEGPFLLEWLAYHKVIGFDSFLIYTNDCSDGTDFMLIRLEELGHVRHVRNEVLRRGPHKSALKYAFEHPILQEAAWVYVADVDEFLNVKTGTGRVDDLVASYPGADVIPVTWRVFSSGGQEGFPFGLCLEKFSDAETATPEQGSRKRFVKSIFRPDQRLEKLGLHAPHYKEEFVEDIAWGSEFIKAHPEGEPRRPYDNYGYDIAQVNHYAVRSVDAYLLKRDRGRANHISHTLGIEYWDKWNRGGTEDTSIQRFLNEVKQRLVDFRSDPELLHLETAAIALNEKRLAELRSRPDFKALRTEILDRRATVDRDDLSPVLAENAKLKAKAPRRHENRCDLLKRMPKNGRCAEIGVWKGGFTVEILSITSPKELVLMDPWGLLAAQDAEDWTHSKNQSCEHMDRMYDGVVNEFCDNKNVTIRKGFSADLLAEYPDDHFDWVYIDGNHLYDFVKQDVELCIRKVRSGGIITGDDYLWKRHGRMHVKEAVNDALIEADLDPKKHLSLQGQQFIIQL